MSKIILASASPRRRELLAQIGLGFDVCPSQKEEVMNGQSPEETVMALAAGKAEDIFGQIDGGLEEDFLIIGADAVVAFEGEILGKPKDEADALRMLCSLQGQTHQVYTGVCLRTREELQVFYKKTDVTMYPVSKDRLEAYIRTGEPMDKAGSYGIQGLGAVLVQEIRGDYNNVVGLPVAEIWQRLMKDPALQKYCEKKLIVLE